MVGQGDPPPPKTTEEIQREAEEEMARAARLARELDKRKGITACRMTLKHRRMRLYQGDATRSSTHGAMLVESDLETGHDGFVRKSVRSSTKESRFTVHWPTTPRL
jgi:hypothetical protein